MRPGDLIRTDDDDPGALVLAVTRHGYTTSVVTFLDPTMRHPSDRFQIGIELIHSRWSTAASSRSTCKEE